MAVDTTEKRMSMLNFGGNGVVFLLPETDGSIDADDRFHLMDLYSGITPDAPVAVVAVVGDYPVRRHRRRKR